MMVPATGKLLEALDVATARMIRLAVANARPGAGTIVCIPPLHKSACGFMSDEQFRIVH